MKTIPHYYQYIQCWFTQERFFSRMVHSCNEDRLYHFVEIGSWKGRSSCYMGVEILNSQKNIQFDCIDTWLGSEEHIDKNSPHYEKLLETEDGLYSEFLHNIEPLKEIINPIRMSSVEASFKYEDESLDFVFIDGFNDYQSVKDDIEHWYPKVKRGGYIAGDDFDWDGVNKAVKEFFGDDVLNPSIGPNKEINTWMSIKK